MQRARDVLSLPPIRRTCRWCDSPFEIPRGAPKETAGRKYCKDECATFGARRSRTESARRIAQGAPRRAKGRPRTLTDEGRLQRKREGLFARFFRRFPDRKPICEARGCGEARIVELAHKKRRNGAWRSFTNTRDQDVWVLCPTCHRCLDRGIQTKEELGLV